MEHRPYVLWLLNWSVRMMPKRKHSAFRYVCVVSYVTIIFYSASTSIRGMYQASVDIMVSDLSAAPSSACIGIHKNNANVPVIPIALHVGSLATWYDFNQSLRVVHSIREDCKIPSKVGSALSRRISESVNYQAKLLDQSQQLIFFFWSPICEH